MFTFNITDRRLNPHGKSLANRQRFVERVKGAVRSAAAKQIKQRDIRDKSDAEVSVSKDGIEEPNFHYSQDRGQWDHILPGNHDFSVGDSMPRPRKAVAGAAQKARPMAMAKTTSVSTSPMKNTSMRCWMIYRCPI
jgi:uncharacterized sporulation protein YeaH/YhbH (DUF444 family)